MLLLTKIIEMKRLNSIKKQLMMKRNVFSRLLGNPQLWNRLYDVKSSNRHKCREKLIV